MSLLDNFPHICNIKKRVGTRSARGGNRYSWPTVHTNVPCWRQTVKDTSVREFERRGSQSVDRVYFLTDLDLDENHLITDLRDKDADAGTGETWEVASEAEPDASAGLGVLFRVMVNKSTTGTTDRDSS